ncbi:MAG: hypothetical protein NWQ46_09915, partial [Spirosomaceae bacterium]|nr:hypothetical protein [Spirosomataceae bacterium]
WSIFKIQRTICQKSYFPNEEAYQIRKAFEYRQAVDYDIEVHISDAEASELYNNAKSFYESTKLYLMGLQNE